MSDLIKREDAIKAIHNYWKKRLDTLPTKESECGEVYADIQQMDKILEHNKALCNFIEAIPSADRPQGWIPCRERMPKKEEATYLICTETGHMCSCRWTNNMYGLGSNEWSKWGWHIMDKPQYAKVVAWMPLKPWKGADDAK